MTEADEERILILLNQFCEVIGGICRELGISYGGVDDDHGEIVGAIRELKGLGTRNRTQMIDMTNNSVENIGVRDAGVGGSNPLFPTTYSTPVDKNIYQCLPKKKRSVEESIGSFFYFTAGA